VDGQPAPDPNEEYLLYQTLVGAWPIDPAAGEFAAFRQRIRDYMLKAVREAKVNSSWTRPNAAYEEALVRFVDLLLQEDPHNHFLADMEEFQRLTTHCGMLNALSQTLLKISSPGIPDFYQGASLGLSPSTRQPAAGRFRLRHRRRRDPPGEEKTAVRPELAADMRTRTKPHSSARPDSGQERELSRGSHPLEVRGGADHVCAFERSWAKVGHRRGAAVFTRWFGSELPLGRRSGRDADFLQRRKEDAIATSLRGRF
jgi:(1->4)-alpha-D-glucan 1-alpha-D-glucosylmutase